MTKTPVECRLRIHLPSWANPGVRRYFRALVIPEGDHGRRFGDQVVWTRVRMGGGGYHGRGGQDSLRLCEAELFELYPSNRNAYRNAFSVDRGDPLWEALYSSFQIWNQDMIREVVRRNQRPSTARSRLARIDRRCTSILIGGLAQLASAGGAGNLMGRVNALAQILLPQLRRSPDMADTLVRMAGR